MGYGKHRRGPASPGALPARHTGGYTLLELLLVMAVSGILLQTSLGLWSLVDRQRQSLSVLELQRLVQFARGQAVNLQRDVTLCALDAQQACSKRWDGNQVAVFTDLDRDRKLDSGEALQLAQWPAERGRLAWRASLGRKYLVFSAMGSTHQNGSFVLCFDEAGERPDVVLTLNRGGRPYLNEPGKRRCPQGVNR